MATLLFATCNCTATLTDHYKPTHSSISPPHPQVQITNCKRSSHVARARRSGLSSRSRRLEKRTKKGGATTTKEEEEEEEEEEGEVVREYSVEVGVGGEGEMEYSKEPMPKLEGLEPDFWEGSQWNALGFFVQYMWAFGILFGLIACGIAVATYNEGATDFKQTPVYKESIQSRELLEEPEASTADVFEANPTETAPSLE